MTEKKSHSLLESLDGFLDEIENDSLNSQVKLHQTREPAKLNEVSEKKANLQSLPVIPDRIQKAAQQLKRLKQQALEVQQAQDDFLKLNDGFLIFKSGSKRFAIRMNCVLEVGRIQHLWWLDRMVRTRFGTFPLKDFKKIHLTAGTPGTVYILIESQLGITAWAIDGIEKTEALKACFIRPVTSFGQKQARTGPFQQIVYENDTERKNNPSSPVYVLHADILS